MLVTYLLNYKQLNFATTLHYMTLHDNYMKRNENRMRLFCLPFILFSVSTLFI